MSISLIISYRDPQRSRDLVPIATHDAFFRCWLPACKQLGLKWIPLFETGYPAIKLDPETLPEVTGELQRLLTFFTESPDQLDSECSAQFISGRIERVLRELGNVVGNWEEIEYLSV